ncbi:hypothetical protein [Virgisporangium aurantiacum]|nr:hypothetical protein [Virgisporangium aurantiacum]
MHNNEIDRTEKADRRTQTIIAIAALLSAVAAVITACGGCAGWFIS